VREIDHLQDPGVDGRIVLKWILNVGSIWFRIGTDAGSCKCGNEPSGSIKRKEFLE
jgi:hypothetical protein